VLADRVLGAAKKARQPVRPTVKAGGTFDAGGVIALDRTTGG
jgi:hypothetical protein